MGLKKHENTIVFPKKEIPDLKKFNVSIHALLVLQISIQTLVTQKSCVLSQHKICIKFASIKKKKSPIEGSIEPALTDQGTPS